MEGWVPSAKDPSDWTDMELKAFNIKLKPVDATEFFNVTELPPSSASPVILNNSTEPETCTLTESKFFSTWNAPCMEMRGLAVATSYATDFEMCGEWVVASPNICLSEPYLCPLIVESCKIGPIPAYYCRSTIIGRAIATFRYNTSLRAAQNIEEETILGIVMAGPSPIFYKIKLDESLVHHIALGQRPATTTVVEWCLPPVESYKDYYDYGLSDLEYRGIILQCLEAFKALL